MTKQREKYVITPGLYVLGIFAILATLPGFYLGLTGQHVGPVTGALVFGMAIFGAAFILSWAAEAAQIDISQGLAIAILALIAVLPEYAVDFVFTWNSAHDPEQKHYALANMTGANRLLVGLGWPLILFLYVIFRKRKSVVLEQSQRVEVFYLGLATLYSFTIPLKGSLNLVDTFILVGLYLLYARRTAQLESVEPDLVGPVKIVANLADTPRRILTAIHFIFSGAVIFFVAEPFAESLVASGTKLGIDEFLLVQWLAPIASETPEFLIAATWTLRGQAGSAMRALISSKVNHWTLLVGTIPLVYAISGGRVVPFTLDEVQDHEIWLTAAQSLFAAAVLINLRISILEGVALMTLFLAQLVVEEIRLEVTVIYMIIGFYYLYKHRRDITPSFRAGLGLKSRNQ